MVLVISQNDGSEGKYSMEEYQKSCREVILLGNPENDVQPGKCSCGFVNKDGAKFCEECGTSIQ